MMMVMMMKALSPLVQVNRPRQRRSLQSDLEVLEVPETQSHTQQVSVCSVRLRSHQTRSNHIYSLSKSKEELESLQWF